MSNNILWPGWETVRLIGRGSFGHVYEIRRDLLGEMESAALKVISIPQNDSDIDELYNDGYNSVSITETFRSHLKSILAEYSLMRKLNDCLNIVSCDDVRYIQHDDGIGWDIYIKMELLTPMMKALPQEIPEQTTVKLGRDLCTALVACSRHGIIHRDIKPQNIFVSREGEYKLGDFGIAKTVEKTMGGTKIGTYKYMAPEVYNNQPYGAQSDIYSLGLVLYWMLNDRRLPFLPLPPQNVTAAQDEQARLLRLSGTPVPPPAHGSEALKRIVLKACAYDPANRYASAEEMLRDLQTLPPIRVVPPTVHSSRTVLPVYPISSSQETAEDLTESAFSSTAQPDKQAPLTNDFSDFFQDTLTEEETVHIFRAKPAANATPKPTQPVPVPQKMPPRPAPQVPPKNTPVNAPKQPLRPAVKIALTVAALIGYYLMFAETFMIKILLGNCIFANLFHGLRGFFYAMERILLPLIGGSYVSGMATFRLGQILSVDYSACTLGNGILATLSGLIPLLVPIVVAVMVIVSTFRKKQPALGQKRSPMKKILLIAGSVVVYLLAFEPLVCQLITGLIGISFNFTATRPVIKPIVDLLCFLIGASVTTHGLTATSIGFALDPSYGGLLISLTVILPALIGLIGPIVAGIIVAVRSIGRKNAQH